MKKLVLMFPAYLIKARAGLVRKQTLVHGHQGNLFYATHWVSPETAKPVHTQSPTRPAALAAEKTPAQKAPASKEIPKPVMKPGVNNAPGSTLSLFDHLGIEAPPAKTLSTPSSQPLSEQRRTMVQKKSDQPQGSSSALDLFSSGANSDIADADAIANKKDTYHYEERNGKDVRVRGKRIDQEDLFSTKTSENSASPIDTAGPKSATINATNTDGGKSHGHDSHAGSADTSASNSSSSRSSAPKPTGSGPTATRSLWDGSDSTAGQQQPGVSPSDGGGEHALSGSDSVGAGSQRPNRATGGKRRDGSPGSAPDSASAVSPGRNSADGQLNLDSGSTPVESASATTPPPTQEFSTQDSSSQDALEAPVPKRSARGLGAEQLDPHTNDADYRLTDELEIGSGGLARKAEDNFAAIDLLKSLESDSRIPSDEEKQTLARYVGWGAFGQAFQRKFVGTELFETFEEIPAYYKQGRWTEADKSHWQVYKRLKERMTSDEYDRAWSSTQNAHYTSTPIVDAMWEAVRHLGFSGGRVLEPALGSGNFFGRQPDDLRRQSLRTGVELDDLTGRIAQLLYPASNVYIKGFQEAPISDNTFDLTISNVPFGRIKVFDATYEDDGRKWLCEAVHNYFFAKALDKARPGGLVAFITSHHTLDAKSSKRVRDYLASQAHFLGAVRLPRDAFAGNAGTQVTTDIIFLQKKDPAFEALHPRDAQGRFIEKWTDTEVTTVPNSKGEDNEIHINQYFAEHPEMMLGTMGVGSGFGLMSETDTGLKSDGRDLTAALQEAIARLPKDVMYQGLHEQELQAAQEIKHAAEYHKPNAFIVEGGKLYKNIEGKLQEHNPASPGDRARIIGMAAIRDALQHLIDAERNGADDATVDSARAHLNFVYDSFVKHNGNLRSVANQRAFYGDPDAQALTALERVEPGTKMVKEGNRMVEKPSSVYHKMDVFHKRTVSALQPATSADSPGDALGIVLNESGRLDFKRLSELLGKSAEEVRDDLAGEGLIYRDPSKMADPHTQGWVTADEFLSGNVREKLAVAKEWAARPPHHSFDSAAANVAALEAVQPPDLRPVDIDANLGANWLDPKHINAFLSHLIGNGDAVVTFNKVLNEWKVADPDWARLQSNNNTQVWGTKRVPAHALLEITLNHRDPKVTFKDEKGTVHTDADATTAALEKQQKLKEEFANWWRNDPERAVEIADLYNQKFNNTVLRKYNGQHLTWPGMDPHIAATRFPHIKDACWRAVQAGRALFDHVVGAGKTSVFISSVMELRRLNLAKKPVILVPNENMPQWDKDAREMYKGAKILTVWKKNWTGKNRRELTNMIATGDWDIVLMTHSAFNKIPCSKETYEQHYGEQINQAMDALEELGFDPDAELTDIKGRGPEARTAKQLARMRDNLKADLQSKVHNATKRQDNSLKWEELGIDSVFCDEWDMSYKNLPFATKMESVSGLSPTGSSRALDFYMKTQHIMRKNNNRGVYLATATPISNTMAEMFNIKRTLMSPEMKKMGCDTFDAWKGLFGETETTLEAAPEGGYRPRKRFAKFVNAPEMVMMYRTVADVLTYKDLPGVVAKLPDIEGGEAQVYASEPSERLNSFMKWIRERAANLSGQNGKDNIPSPEVDNFLTLTVDARKASLDLRLVDPSAPDDPNSKVNHCVKQVLQCYQECDDYKGTQLLFLDLSTPKGSPDEKKKQKIVEAKIQADNKADNEDGDDEKPENNLDDESAEELNENMTVYQDIKNKLIAAGIPAHEVAFAHDFNTDAKKTERDRKMNNGELRVLIGSTGKMGAGLNVQQRLYANHHLDCPWRPRDLEQRDGRIIRQGNLHKVWDKSVKIFRYATKGSFDEYMWQGIVKKQGFITQAKSGNLTDRQMGDADALVMNAQQVQAASSNNPLVRDKVATELKLERLRSLRDSHEDARFDMQRELSGLPGMIQAKQQQVKNHREAAGHLDEATQIWEANKPAKPEHFSIQVKSGVGESATHKSHDKREDAGKALILAHAQNARHLPQGQSVPIASYAGFTVEAAPDPDPKFQDAFYAIVKDPNGKRVGTVDIAANPTAQVTKIENVLRGLADKAHSNRSQADDHEKQIQVLQAKEPQLREHIAKPFEHDAEYHAERRKLEEIEKKLSEDQSVSEVDSRVKDFGYGDHILLMRAMKRGERKNLQADKKVQENRKAALELIQAAEKQEDPAWLEQLNDEQRKTLHHFRMGESAAPHLKPEQIAKLYYDYRDYLKRELDNSSSSSKELTKALVRCARAKHLVFIVSQPEHAPNSVLEVKAPAANAPVVKAPTFARVNAIIRGWMQL